MRRYLCDSQSSARDRRGAILSHYEGLVSSKLSPGGETHSSEAWDIALNVVQSREKILTDEQARIFSNRQNRNGAGVGIAEKRIAPAVSCDRDN
jgi:hypothetical protein